MADQQHISVTNLHSWSEVLSSSQIILLLEIPYKEAKNYLHKQHTTAFMLSVVCL